MGTQGPSGIWGEVLRDVIVRIGTADPGIVNWRSDLPAPLAAGSRYVLRRSLFVPIMTSPSFLSGEERLSMESETSDQHLILRIAQGDEGSLSILYDRHASLLLAVAIRILGDRGEAEDAVQAVFVRIWKEASRYDSRKAPVRVWLVFCVRHAAIDRVRRREVQQKITRQAVLRYPLEPSEADVPWVKENQERIVEAIGTLPAEQKEAIELAYFEGLSQSQIAVRLEQPLGTVKTRLRLGMGKLREALAGFVRERK